MTDVATGGGGHLDGRRDHCREGPPVDRVRHMRQVGRCPTAMSHLAEERINPTGRGASRLFEKLSPRRRADIFARLETSAGKESPSLERLANGHQRGAGAGYQVDAVDQLFGRLLHRPNDISVGVLDVGRREQNVTFVGQTVGHAPRVGRPLPGLSRFRAVVTATGRLPSGIAAGTTFTHHWFACVRRRRADVSSIATLAVPG